MNDILINKGTHVVAAVVEFTDGRSKAELISEGSKEECEALAEFNSVLQLRRAGRNQTPIRHGADASRMASAKRKGDPVSENANLVFVVVDERELHVMGNAIGRAVIERETGVTSQPWLPAAMVWADAPDDWARREK